MRTFFTDIELFFFIGTVAFVAGVVLSTKIIDAFEGVSADTRAALTQVQTATVADLKVAHAAVVAKLPGVKVKVAAVPVVAPVAPVVVTPVVI